MTTRTVLKMGIRNFLAKQFQSLVQGSTIHPRDNLLAFNIPRTRFDYAREVGTGLGSNVLMSPVQWVMRTFPESPLALTRTKADGQPEPILKHPFLDLLAKPNESYTYEALIMATMLSWSMAGNAYWIKVRNASEVGSRVIQLWYAPHWMMQPKAHPTDPSIFIDHYQYCPAGQTFKLDVEDVVHFRFGLNPSNPRLGLGPINAVLREIYTDDEAANYSAAILRNMGVPGVIISPDTDEGIDVETAKAVKEKFRQTFTGDRKGDIMVNTIKTKVDTFGHDPKKMNLAELRNVPEERVCAALGIPPAVIGFGTGLQTTKVGATMAAMIKLAYTGNIIPSQRPIAQTIEDQVLREFDTSTDLTVGFDNSKISALQEDKNAMVKRVGNGVREGWAMVSDARRAEGLPVDDVRDDVFLRPLNLVEIEAEE